MSGAEEDGKPGPATRLVEAGRRPEWTGMPGQPGRIVNPPVWRASTILYDDVAHLRAARGTDHQRLFYGRKGTPTAWALAEALTEMEPDAAGTMLYPSGVAAIACALLAVLKPGDRLLMVDNAYDPTRSFCARALRAQGIETEFYDPMIGAGIEDLLTERTRAIFMESPGSLTMEVQDVPAIVEVARRCGVTTLIDNTWATPLYFRPLALGVDISIVGCTKYVGGHSDLMMGAVTAREPWWKAVRDTAYLYGQTVAPDDAALALRGLRTLPVRLKQHETGALAVARWLAERDDVLAVRHPALEGSPGHAEWRRDFSGSTGLFSFALDGDDAARVRLIDALARFGIGYSWGGFESLALPVDPQHFRTATKWDQPGALIRLHIGLEDPGDLIADLQQAFDTVRESS